MLSLIHLFVILPIFANALHDLGHHAARHSKLNRISSHKRSTRKLTGTYVLEDLYNGDNFFETWDFFSNSDPTHGLVDYQTKHQARQLGLAEVQTDGTTRLQVDNTTYLGLNEPRKSVRVSTKKTYNGGLFIADFWSMPHGCSTWPAYWSVGPNWPNSGEIDIIEGVHRNKLNQYTLHTGADCLLEDLGKATGNILGLTCASSNNDNSGCAFQETDDRSYGHGFNKEAGGVYVHRWDSQGIYMWFFSRCDIPDDIEEGNPDPDSWGAPSAIFPFTSCSSDHFRDHSLIIDTTLCGDWAGNAYDDECPKSCAEVVQDPANFQTAKWDLNYIATYQLE